MTRSLACVLCRQSKLRCNASDTYPAPCSRCSSRKWDCKIDSNYKRVPSRKRLEQLTQEVERLRKIAPIDESAEATPTLSERPSQDAETSENVDHVTFNLPPVVAPRRQSANRAPITPDAYHLDGFQLGHINLSVAKADELFQLYMMHCHDHLPVLDIGLQPSTAYKTCELLFWTVIFTAARMQSSSQELAEELSASLQDLVSNSILTRSDDPIAKIQAWLILSTWPVTVQRQSDDMRWMLSGAALQLATQNGLHHVGYEHEYRAFEYSKNVYDEHKHTRIWRCWCFSNAMLSSENGLPCLVPFDALELGPMDEAALPPEFYAKLRVALYISRINDALGSSTLKDPTYRMRTIRLLERDLQSLASTLRRSHLQWTPTVEFVHLAMTLNLYSWCLRGPQSSVSSAPEDSILQSSAASAASQMVRMYTSASFAPHTFPGMIPQAQRCYPKFFFRFTVIAVFALLKIALLNRISPVEIRDVENSVRQATNTFAACAKVEDEYHQAARVVSLLCRKEVIESAQSKYPVQSRLGASLYFEFIVAAVQWRKRQNEPKTSSEHISSNASNRSDAGPANPTPLPTDPDSILFDIDSWVDNVDFTAANLPFQGDFDWFIP